MKSKAKPRPPAAVRRYPTAGEESAFKPGPGDSNDPPSLARPAVRAPHVYERLAAAYPDARCSLDFQTPLQLLVATILSAQCTDERVNQVTPALFSRYPAVQDFATAELVELEDLVRSTGFYKNKARSIKAACQLILDRHQGNLPRSMEAMVALPGIGRKTANVVLANAFGVPGMPIDTHAKRILGRLELTRETDPEQIEQDVYRLLPPEKWAQFSHLLIYHGRAVCKAPKPRCELCVVREWCPYPAKIDL